MVTIIYNISKFSIFRLSTVIHLLEARYLIDSTINVRFLHEMRLYSRDCYALTKLILKSILDDRCKGANDHVLTLCNARVSFETIESG